MTFAAILPLLLKALEFFLDWSKADRESKEKFLDLLKSMEKHKSKSVDLRENYDMKIAQIRAERETARENNKKLH